MENQTKNHDKLTDKAFSRSVIISIIGIVICIICLCSTTYAWFTESLPSQGNEIKMAEECLLSITLTKEGIPLEVVEDKVELEARVPYTVTLSLPKNSASGYYIITAEGKSYYTDYIARHQDDEPHTVTFELTAETDRLVTITPRWGIYVQESDVVDSKLNLP